MGPYTHKIETILAQIAAPVAENTDSSQSSNPKSLNLGLCGVLLLALQTARVAAGSQFASHVSVNTPARSFSHGVGDPLPSAGRQTYQRQPAQPFRSRPRPPQDNQGGGRGYPRVKPLIPFNEEEVRRDNSMKVSPWQYNSFREEDIPLLPPSPYKVDSPDPESLWPEGLFLPPIRPLRFASPIGRRSDIEDASDTEDPFLLEGSEAIAAVQRANGHGHLYFHEIPHIESLLANQEVRIKNQLKPHRLGSIRYTWPYNRP